MIKAFVLHHPQSANLLRCRPGRGAFNSGDVTPLRIACGTSLVPGCDLSEAADFSPNYASWNGILFETSVILTVWEHARRLVGDDHVAFLHSDNRPGHPAKRIWGQVRRWLDDSPRRSVALTAPAPFRRLWPDFVVPGDVALDPEHDPMLIHPFEHGVNVWDYVHKYDPGLYDWAFRTQPRLVYSHQFACSRATLDKLGAYLYEVVRKFVLADCGLWTPHVVERLIGLFLVRHGGPAVHTTAFWHSQSSGRVEPGCLKLYGHRSYRYWSSARRVQHQVQESGLDAFEEVGV